MGLIVAFVWVYAHPAVVQAAALLPAALKDSTPLEPDQRAAAEALGQASAALDRGDSGAAAVWLKKAEALTLLGDHLDFQRIRLEAARGQHAEAASRAAQTVSRFPDSPLAAETAALHAEALAATGQEVAAREAWELAIRGSGDLRRRKAFRAAIARSLQRTGELDGAGDPSQLAEQVADSVMLPLERPVADRSAAEELAVAKQLASQGRSEEAVASYVRALELDLSPDERKQARLRLGHVLFKLREYDRALDVFRSLAPSPEATLYWARSLARTGQLDAAIEKLEALAATGPPEIASQSAYLAGTLLEDGDTPHRASSHYARVVRASESQERVMAALWRLGWMAWRRGDEREARARFLEMIALENSPAQALRPRYWAARAALAMASKRDQREGQAELVALATDWPLSYYGWRAQEQLGGTSPRAKADRSDSRPEQAQSSENRAMRRVALLTAAGLEDAARGELSIAAREARTMNQRIQVGQLAVALDDYHTGQRLLLQAYPELLGQGIRPGETELFWLAWPPAYRDFVLDSRVSRDGSVEAELIWAIMREESGFRPAVMSSAGAVGLLQLMPETARNTALRQGWTEPESPAALQLPDLNIRLGSAYLAYLSGRFPGRVSAVVASYNAGPTAVTRWLEGGKGEWADDEWVEDIPYAQTRAYTKRVLRSLHAYRSLYDFSQLQ